MSSTALTIEPYCQLQRSSAGSRQTSIGSNTVAIGQQETIAAVQTFARHGDLAGWGCAVIANTPTSLTELASLGLSAVK
jgi:hypothetical protein